MNHSYLTAGMTFGRLLKVLVRNKTCWHDFRIAGRILFLIQSSFWSSIFAVAEHLRYAEKIRRARIKEDPVFIIGHWRTGTTLLYKLMSLDSQFVCPNLFQVAEPDSLLTSYSYYRPVMKTLVRKTRPMDNVGIDMDEPQEDEYAVFRLTCCSPLEKLVFPEREQYFLEKMPDFIMSEEERKVFSEQILCFYQKLLLKTQGRILIKNPFHSYRIKELRSLFPGARFIHLHRHPFRVVPSTINMWNILQNQNALNRNRHDHQVEEVCRVFQKTTDRILSDVSDLPREKFAEVSFEELEGNPVKVIRRLYSELQLDCKEDFTDKAEKYLKSLGKFRKNQFSLEGHEEATIREKMNPYMQKYLYS